MSTAIKTALIRFLRTFAFATVSAVAVYWMGHLGDMNLPVWLLGLIAPALTGALAAVDKWARENLKART
mgnify:CR=1 FL=1